MSNARHQSLLWKITSSHHPAPSWLLGTMHITGEEARKIITVAEKKILQCDVLALEVNVDAFKDLPKDIFLIPGEKKISDLMPEKNFNKLRAIIRKAYGIDILMYNRILPLQVVNLISSKIIGGGGNFSMDMHVWRFAERHEKELMGLEPAEKQIEFLQKIPLDYQVKTLKRAAANVSRFRRNIERMNRHYSLQHLPLIHKRTAKSAGKLKKLLLYERNKTMAGEIASLANRCAVFAAVGTGHLYGEKGILRLLKKKNFRIEPESLF